MSSPSEAAMDAKRMKKMKEKLELQQPFGHGDHQQQQEEEEEEEEENRASRILNLNSNCNWLDLPDSLFLFILDRLSPSIPDLLSSSAVCFKFRSLIKSSSPRPFVPPLLLHLDNHLSFSLTQPFPTSSSSHHPPPRSFHSKISAKPLSTKCLGHSYGHLIFGFPRREEALISDVFTANDFSPPKLPPSYSVSDINFGILTAPPSSPSCMLLLVFWHSSGSNLLSWKVGADGNDNVWEVFKPNPPHFIHSALVFRGQAVICLLSNYSLLVSESVVGPVRTSWKEVGVRFPNMPKGFVYPRRLVDCNGEILLVLFVQSETQSENSSLVNSQLYRLDIKKCEWVEIESIGDWCLFNDGAMRGFLACANPGRWGGRSNCIYDSETLSEFPLDGTPFNSALLSPVPSSVWVYPKMFL